MDDLLQLLRLMPPGSLVPAAWVVEQLQGEGPEPATPDAVAVDLTVEEVAERIGRKPGTVRGWCREGALRAYKLNGVDWRIPPAALEEYLERQRQGEGPKPAPPGKGADLGSWRKLRKAS